MVKPAENTAANNETKQFPAWNEEEYYDKEIVPLLKELIEKLDARRIPHLLHVMFSDDGKKKSVGTIMHRHDRENTFDIFVSMQVAEGKAIAISKELGAGLLGAILVSKKED